MTAEENKIPPLEELVKGSLKEVQDFLPSLSLPEILIVGAMPFDRQPRPYSEVKVFGEYARQKFKAVITERNNILYRMCSDLGYPIENMDRVHITDWLRKYEILVRGLKTNSDLMESLPKQIAKDVTDLRNSIKNYREKSKGRDVKNIGQLERLEQYPLNLVCYSYPQKSGNSEPYFIVVKTKVDSRIAEKIPYKMIYQQRERDGVLDDKEFKKNVKRHIRLNDGVIRDNSGLQFITYDLEELITIKQYLFQSEDIEVLGNTKGETIDDYYGERKGPYHAFHMDVIPNKSDVALNQIDGKPALFDPHRDPIEVILMEIPYFADANFGSDSYFRRMVAQKDGIVNKDITHGMLKVDPFTPTELQWKQMLENRIMTQLTYGEK